MITENQIKQAAEKATENRYQEKLENMPAFSSTLESASGYFKGHEDGGKWMQSQQSEWISVKDRLPETIRLLAFTGGLTITLTYIDGIYYSGDGHIWCSEVTHWMPLPTSPR